MLTLWNGFDRKLTDDFRFFDQLAPVFAGGTARPERLLPRVDVIETDDSIKVSADIPGFKADDVSITFDDGMLVLEGKVTAEKKQEGKLLYSERRSASFRRTFKLNVDIDVDRGSAAMKDGVLTLVLPKVPAAQPRKIKVSTEQ